MKNIFRSGVLGLSLILVTVVVAIAEPASQVVPFAAVPAPAQRTMLAESGNGKGKLGEIERLQEYGEVWYDATLAKGKVERTFSVAPDGRLLNYQVFMHEIPEAARKTIREQVRANKDRLGEIYRVVDDGKVTYEADMTKGEKEISFSVSPDGKLLTMEMAIEETPDAVQKAIRVQAAGASIKSIEKNMTDEDGEIAYDVELDKGGKKVSFSVDANGKMLED